MSSTIDQEQLAPGDVERYREDGFIVLRGVLSRDEALEFRDAAIAAMEKIGNYAKQSGTETVFSQALNAWQHDDTMRRLTLHPRIGALAEQLSGVPMRLWHDQILIKEPGISVPTEYHQDQPYWPHENSSHPLTAWIALGDVPFERGCMSFIPKSHLRTDLERQDLKSESSLFEIAPDLIYEPRETYPLRAGDLTFHHGRTAHTANANKTDEPRVAHAIIFIDAATRFNGVSHPITRELGLSAGEPLPDQLFPRVGKLGG
jgi:ectoine hydroxylase-related dioxygenase (phytanoyl-CoA dioxygenase family)